MDSNKIIHLYPKFWESPTQYTFETTLEALELNGHTKKTIAIFIKYVIDSYPLIIPDRYKNMTSVKPVSLSCWDLLWGIRFNRSKKYIDGFFAAYLATGCNDFKWDACDISDIIKDSYGRELFNMLV
jgi:hypothetical protein